MTLTVEDGTGIAGADAYGAIQDFKDYWDLVGYDYTSKSDAEIEISARNGTNWIESEYRSRLPGIPTTDTQGLHFPADDAYDVYGRELTGVPGAMFNATAEAAYRELIAPNSLTPDFDRAEGFVTSRTVGPISRTFERVWPAGLPPILTSVQNALSPLIGGRENTKRLLRG